MEVSSLSEVRVSRSWHLRILFWGHRACGLVSHRPAVGVRFSRGAAAAAAHQLISPLSGRRMEPPLCVED